MINSVDRGGFSCKERLRKDIFSWDITPSKTIEYSFFRGISKPKTKQNKTKQNKKAYVMTSV